MAARHECWDLFVPKDRTPKAQSEKPVPLKDWFDALTKSHPKSAPASAGGGQAKPH
jgi:hypothetical protein